MCGVGLCHHIHRNICLCLAIYTLVGSRVPCVYCNIPHFSPNDHLKLLFSSLTNGSQYMDKDSLSHLLKNLHIFNDGLHSDKHASKENKCLTTQEMLDFFSVNQSRLNEKQFETLLPTIVYELNAGVCKHKHEDEAAHSTNTFDWKAFLAASGAVLLVSASGLVVVCLVPMMSRSFYNVVTQFLIALAVGSLAGDAFLHLIPHAFSSNGHHHKHDNHHDEHGHDNHNPYEPVSLTEINPHRKMILEALIALLGIYIFFLTERLTIICQNRMSRRKLKRQRSNGPLNFLDFNEGKDVDHKNGNRLTGPDSTHLAIDDIGNYKQIENNSSGDNPMLNRGVNQEVKNSNNGFHISAPDGGNGYDGGCGGGGVGSGGAGTGTGGGIVGGVSPGAPNEGQLCNRPPDRPMDNNRCVDYLNDKQLHSSDGGNQPSWSFNANAFQSSQNGNEKLDKLQQQQSINGTDGIVAFADLRKSSLNNVNNKMSGSGGEILDMRNNNDKQLAALELSNHTQGQNDLSNGGGGAGAGIVKKNSSFSYLGSAEQSHTHPHRDKPHGHHHGHSHDLSSVRAIAYTIIAGDGLHNFCDGIAIGAAFANDIRGGLSTSIAVLCHELPHELGDFAVLLHAGMSVKSALFYNLLSSVLCAGGMILGFLLGGLHSLDTWIFMLAAGMFVYIALVDMMPELSANQLKGDRRCHQPSVLFLWQNLGILLGFCIMLLIAFYEDALVSH
uniref:Zinc transporter ZIP10 n=1 Tax=Trichobilharzia regenti TaxID=157069 RepID=A0AA85KBD0_TRIRE|nr:unnamed protein product [Trichobilharzia regenti]